MSQLYLHYQARYCHNQLEHRRPLVNSKQNTIDPLCTSQPEKSLGKWHRYVAVTLFFTNFEKSCFHAAASWSSESSTVFHQGFNGQRQLTLVIFCTGKSEPIRLWQIFNPFLFSVNVLTDSSGRKEICPTK